LQQQEQQTAEVFQQQRHHILNILDASVNGKKATFAVELDVSDSVLVDLPLGASKAKGAIKPSSPVKARNNGEHQAHSSSDDAYASRHSHDDARSREALEAAARAQLRTKFDHVGIDSHLAAVNNRDALAIAESRGMKNSPPPPNIMAVGAPLPPGHGGLLRSHNAHGDHEHHHSPVPVRVPSPILFGHGSDGLVNPNLQLLQLHHAAALAGVPPSPDLVNLHISGSAASGPPTSLIKAHTSKELDVESCSSASLDIDSESDDVSLDDSASDRSDGSDSGHATA
jgi:hypothetical protein